MTDVRPMANRARQLPAPSCSRFFILPKCRKAFEDISIVKGAKYSETQTKMANRRQAEMRRQTSQQRQAETATERTGKSLGFLEGGKQL